MNELITTTQESKQLANDLIALTAMPGDLVQRELDANYLAMLIAEHPTLDKKYFVDFIHKAQLTGADPRLNQIYLVVHNAWNSETRTTSPKGTVIHDYKFLMSKAESTNELGDRHVETIEEPYLDIVTGRKRASWSSIATITRKGKVTTFKARFWEFAKTNKEGIPSGNWKAMPVFMLEKCAMACALRWAFPDTLGSIYIREEMEKVFASNDTAVKPHHVAPAAAPLAAPTPAVPPALPQEYNTGINYKDEIIDFISHAPFDFFEKVKRDRANLLTLAINENDPIKLKRIHDWLIANTMNRENNGITESEGSTITENAAMSVSDTARDDANGS